MKVLIRLFIDIALRRRGPQDLPDSSFLLAMALGCYLLLGTALSALYQPRSSQRIAALTLLDVGLLVGWFGTVLAVSSRRHRLRQTLTALLGTGALLSGVQILLKLLADFLAPRESLAAFPAIGLFVVLIWLIVIIGHIMRQALDTTMIVGVLIALGYALAAIAAGSVLTRSLT